MPRGMIAPSPNCFSIWASVFFRSGFDPGSKPTSLAFLPALLAAGVSLAMRLLDLVAVTMAS